MDFVDPPPSKYKKNSDHWLSVVKKLKENPNEWGLVGDYSIGVSTHIKKGRYPAFYPKGKLGDKSAEEYVAEHWEITTRSHHQESGIDVAASAFNRVDIYIRWKQ